MASHDNKDALHPLIARLRTVVAGLEQATDGVRPLTEPRELDLRVRVSSRRSASQRRGQPRSSALEAPSTSMMFGARADRRIVTFSWATAAVG
jgi:hypothetical protein